MASATIDWRDESERLLSIQRGIAASAGDLDEVMRRVCEGVLSLIPQAAAATIEMRDGSEIVFRAKAGHVPLVEVGLRLPIGHSLSGHCLSTGEPQITFDTSCDPRVGISFRQLRLSVICAPIPSLAGPVGVLKALAGKPGAFGERELLILQLLVVPLAFGLAAAEQIDAARANQRLATRFAATFDQAAVGIAHVAIDGSFLMVNDRFCQIVGHSRERLLQDHFQRITHPEDLAADVECIRALVDGSAESYALEKRYLRADGEIAWVNLTVSLVREEDGPGFFMAVVEDISARKAAEALAHYDSLTGLPNRRSLLLRVDQLLARVRQAEKPVGIAFLDLDRFKSINDRLGHAEGDRCLIAVAAALRETIRDEDLVARLAGDEFVVVLPGATRDTGRRMLRRLRRAVAAATQPNGWDIGLSAGLVIAHPAAAGTAQALIGAADRLMYRAKRGTGERIVVEELAPALRAA